MKEPIIKYSMPSRYDAAKFGTIYKVMGDGEHYTLLIQTSEDEQIAQWQPIGSMLEKAFNHFLCDADFIAQCLALSCNRGDKAILYGKIGEIITK